MSLYSIIDRSERAIARLVQHNQEKLARFRKSNNMVISVVDVQLKKASEPKHLASCIYHLFCCVVAQ